MSDDFRFIMVRENYAEDATFSGGSFETGLPVTNLQSAKLGLIARTTNSLNASTQFDIDLGSVRQIGAVIVYGINATLESQYQVITSNDSGFADILYDSGVKDYPGFQVDPITELVYGDADFWDGVLTNTLMDELPRSLIEVIPAEDWVDGLCRYCRVKIFDESNPVGYFQAQYVFIGPADATSINYGESNSTGVTPLSDYSLSLSAKKTSYDRALQRTWSGAFGWQTHREMFGNEFRSLVKNRQSKPVFIIPDRSDHVYLQQRSFPATYTALSKIQQLVTVTSLNATTRDFEEWK